MKPLRDPEGAEPEHLFKACHLEGANVIEIGCGDGRLTWRYAAFPRLVAGIDPKLSTLSLAHQSATNQKTSARFACAKVEALPFAKHTFDAAIFAWSL
jgi:ubiquinone/menaquinone biosynthesis C-methylase UbiE